MIVKMKKVSLLCLAADRERTLDALCDLGVMHITPVRPPAGTDIDLLRTQAADATKALSVLARFTDGSASPATPSLSPAEVTLATLSASRKLADLHARLAELESEHKSVAPFGGFDPADIRRLAKSGIHVHLFVAPSLKGIQIPEGFVMEPLGESPSGSCFALVGRGAAQVRGAREVPVAERGLAEIESALHSVRRDIERASQELAKLASNRDSVVKHLRGLSESIEFAKARASMGDSGNISYLQGFAPADSVEDIRARMAKLGCAMVAEDPGAEDAVPTLIRNPRLVRPIRFMFELIGVLPGYREADISPVFLVFYSLFFAILVGDAGYGALLLVAALVVRFTCPRVPSDLLRLLTILSLATIAWGMATGTYFSLSPLPGFLLPLRSNWLLDERNLMGLCFLVGAIHLTIAHVWTAIRTINSTLALAQAGWIALTWTMYFAARNMILDYPMPAYVSWLFFAGLTAVAIFMTAPRALKTEWPNHIMLPLNVINNFGDVVSYVRLFAVGSASAAISVAFNEMALGSGISDFGTGVKAAVILLLAHGLNITLCALGVIVHGVRLNTLEFCGHMGIQWTGLKYVPFARHNEDGTP